MDWIEPGKCDKMTRRTVRIICKTIVKKVDSGLTKVAMLGKIGDCRKLDETLDR
jgi:hypothetical protein